MFWSGHEHLRDQCAGCGSRVDTKKKRGCTVEAAF